MYDRSFFQSKLGKVSAACIAAMCAFVAFSSQVQLSQNYSPAPPSAILSQIISTELA